MRVASSTEEKPIALARFPKMVPACIEVSPTLRPWYIAAQAARKTAPPAAECSLTLQNLDTGEKKKVPAAN